MVRREKSHIFRHRMIPPLLKTGTQKDRMMGQFVHQHNKTPNYPHSSRCRNNPLPTCLCRVRSDTAAQLAETPGMHLHSAMQLFCMETQINSKFSSGRRTPTGVGTTCWKKISPARVEQWADVVVNLLPYEVSGS